MTASFPCRRCPYQGTSYADLSRHFQVTHAGEPAPPSGPTKRQPISEVGERTDAGLACPKCGGVQFKVKRSGRQKAMLGVASMLVKGTQVRCVTCGTVYKRG